MPYHEVLQQFLEESGGHVVLDTDLRVLDAGPEFSRITKTRREDMIGTLFTNIFTEPNIKRHLESTETIKSGVAIAMKTKNAYAIKVTRSDIVDPETRKLEERWWKPTVTPIVDSTSGGVKYFVLRMEDVTTTERTFRAIKTQRRLLYVLYGIIVIAITGVAILLSHNIDRTTMVSGETCMVQKESIRGNILLSHIMADISGIIVNSPQPARPVSKEVVHFGLRLEKDLTQYLNVIHHLPTHRNCH